jgi:DNA modification methylase
MKRATEYAYRVAEGPGWTLTCGNCLDPVTGMASLGDKSVDHVITDPPYEAEAHTLQRRTPLGNGHGTSTVEDKPLGLMERLVRLFTNPNDLILDPFAGSGTTGVAAIRLGRRFIGWEKDPKYHAIAVKRLTAAREQLEMFRTPAVLP